MLNTCNYENLGTNYIFYLRGGTHIVLILYKSLYELDLCNFNYKIYYIWICRNVYKFLVKIIIHLLYKFWIYCSYSLIKFYFKKSVIRYFAMKIYNEKEMSFFFFNLCWCFLRIGYLNKFFSFWHDDLLFYYMFANEDFACCNLCKRVCRWDL